MKFAFGSNAFEIKGNFVSAKANNINDDHYLFAPDEFASEASSIVTIYLTTSANEFDVMPANSDLIEAMKAKDYSQMRRSGNNPYYDLGIPDSTFKTATNSWRWLSAGKDVYGNYLPIKYYAYSYTKYGNPNIMTHIMIVGHAWQRDANYTSYYGENNDLYAKASGMLMMAMLL